MIATLNKQELQSALGIACSATSKVNVAYLSCVLIDAADMLSFEATNLVEAARCESAALVEEPGRALLPAARLQSIVKALPDEAVRIEADSSAGTIVCGSSKVTLPALDPEEFPGFPKPEPLGSVALPGESFCRMVRCVSGAASKRKDHENTALSGIKFESDGGSFRMAATDSYRCLCCEAENGDAASFEAVIPASFAQTFASMKPSGNVVVSMAQNQIVLSADGVTLVSRSLNGIYPKWETLFDRCGDACRVAVGRDALAGALRMASAVTSGKGTVLLDVSGDSLTVSCAADDEGSMVERIECDCEGEASIKASCDILSTTLSSLDCEDVVIKFGSPNVPIYMAGGSSRSVVMPVR